MNSTWHNDTKLSLLQGFFHTIKLWIQSVCKRLDIILPLQQLIAPLRLFINIDECYSPSTWMALRLAFLYRANSRFSPFKLKKALGDLGFYHEEGFWCLLFHLRYGLWEIPNEHERPAKKTKGIPTLSPYFIRSECCGLLMNFKLTIHFTAHCPNKEY